MSVTRTNQLSDGKGNSNMNRIMVIVLLTVAAGSVAFSQQSKPKAEEEERTRQALMQLERDIGKANLDSDYAFFDRVEAEEFIFTDAGGGVTTKKQDLEGLKQTPNPDGKLTAYEVDHMNVRWYDKTAVVPGRVPPKRLVKGQAMTSQSRFTDVFVW